MVLSIDQVNDLLDEMAEQFPEEFYRELDVPQALSALSIARQRVENPELTLSQLAALCDPPVTKSALNHRLRKLVELASQS